MRTERQETTEQGPLRVLESFSRIDDASNPYITQLARAFESDEDLELVTFTWRDALLGRYDVFHVHWPELMMGGHRAIGRAARRLLTVLFCLRLWVGSTPVVRTWHNVERPTGLAWMDQRLLDVFDWLTTVRIRLNRESSMPTDAAHVTIVHGHYRDWFERYQREDPVSGRVAYVGQVRRYKGVEGLIAAFRALPDERLSLLVAGKPSSSENRHAVTKLAADDPRIILRLEYLDEAEFVRAVTSAELVVLPYRFMHNSGAVLAALSLDRPVLVPANDVNRSLAEEVGPGWVQLYHGDLTAEALRDAWTSVRSHPPADRPDLSARSWETAAADHREAFREAVALRRSGALRRSAGRITGGTR